MMARLALVSALFGFGCGEEPLPVCPTGDCTLPSLATLKWRFNHYPELLFDGDTCKDLGVQTVRAEIVGIDDPEQYELKDVDCNQGQASFVGMPPGNYSIVITPLDANGDSIVNAPIATPIEVGFAGSDTLVTALVPYESWIQTYTGTLLFRLSWAGASCETAVPAVATQTLNLVAGGVIATVTTDLGQLLDGTDPQPCRPHAEPFAQFAEGLPFGPATFTVTGTDTGGMLAFEHTFETFVGAAKNNPTIMFDVPAPPPPP